MPSDTLYDWALPLKSPALASCCHGSVSDLESHRALIASHLNVNQPKISALSSYDLDGFSVERLMIFLTVLDQDVEMVIRRKPKSRKVGRIPVTAARR